MPALEAFHSLEDTVNSTLDAAVSSSLATLIDQIKPLIDKGDYTGAHAAVSRFTLMNSLDPHLKRMEEIMVSALLLGAHIVTGDLKYTSFVQGTQKIPAQLQQAIAQMKLTVEQNGSEIIRQRANEFIAAENEKAHAQHYKSEYPEWLRDWFQKAGETTDLADRLNAAVMGTGKAVVDLSANLTTSRLVSLGFLSEATQANVTEYKISAELDKRVCPACRALNGKVFRVADEFSRIVQTLGTSDPNELRSLAPWPSQTKEGIERLKAQTNAQLQANGYGSPPYHPGCRCVLVMVGHTTVEGPTITPSDIENIQANLPAEPTPEPVPASRIPVRAPATVQDFVDAGATNKYLQTTENAVEAYNNIIGIPPAALSRYLEGDSGFKLALKTAVGGSGMGAQDISLTWEIQNKDGERLGSLVRSFRDEGAGLTVDHALFEINKASQGSGFAKDLFARSMELYQDLGVANVQVHANIDVGGYAWAKFGFVPSAGSWEGLADEMKQTLGMLYDIPDDVRTAVIALLKSDDPKTIWAISDLTATTENFDGKVMTLGKRLLLGTDWFGDLTLEDAEALGRYQAYTSKAPRAASKEEDMAEYEAFKKADDDTSSTALFYMQNGKKQDADLWNPILDAVSSTATVDDGAKQAAKVGLSAQQIRLLYQLS